MNIKEKEKKELLKENLDTQAAQSHKTKEEKEKSSEQWWESALYLDAPYVSDR